VGYLIATGAAEFDVVVELDGIGWVVSKVSATLFVVTPVETAS
jgi:hypothetical protein